MQKYLQEKLRDLNIYPVLLVSSYLHAIVIKEYCSFGYRYGQVGSGLIYL
jgi:hypothetical protein